MPQILAQILMEITSAWRFRWVGAAAAWLVCLLGWAWIATQPDIFQATAVVYVDTTSVLRPVLDNRIVSADVETQISYVRQALLGREHLERVVRENNLDATARNEREREEVIERLRTRIVISAPAAVRGSGSTYTITYQGASRQGSVAIVTTLLNSLVEDTRKANVQNADTAERFLDDRILEYENRLRQAEQARADFKRANAGRLSGDTGGYFARIETERRELEEKRRDLRLATARLDRLRQQLSGDLPVTPFAFGGAPTGTNAEIGAIDARIATYKEQLDKLLLDYTDRHPDVVAIRETLTRLEGQRAEQQALLSANPQAVVSTMSTNPVYQEGQIRLNETEVEIAELEAGIAERQASLDKLQGLMNELPEVEASLARLNRDYDVIYDQYQALVRSRETQDLSRKAQDTDQVDFRVINPPLAGFEPVAPQRLALLAGVFVAALGVGGALCWLFAQLKPVFSETRTLSEMTGLPVLGAVYRVVAPGSTLFRRHVGLVSFAATMGALAVVFVGVIAIEVIGPGMHSFVGG